MLTTTYSIVVLSAEQQHAHHLLRKLEKCLRGGIRKGSENVDLSCLRKVFARIASFEQRCHERTVERYVIPALRSAGDAGGASGTASDAGGLLARLDVMNAGAVRILRYVRDQMQRAVDGGEVDVETLVTAMQLYCEQAIARLALEETELFPLARRLLSNEEWFRIAARCLSDGAARPTAFKPAPSSGRRHRGRQCPVH